MPVVADPEPELMSESVGGLPLNGDPTVPSIPAPVYRSKCGSTSFTCYGAWASFSQGRYSVSLSTGPMGNPKWSYRLSNPSKALPHTEYKYDYEGQLWGYANGGQKATRFGVLLDDNTPVTGNVSATFWPEGRHSGATNDLYINLFNVIKHYPNGVSTGIPQFIFSVHPEPDANGNITFSRSVSGAGIDGGFAGSNAEALAATFHYSRDGSSTVTGVLGAESRRYCYWCNLAGANIFNE